MTAHLIRQGLKGLLQLCGATALALLVVSCTMRAEASDGQQFGRQDLGSVAVFTDPVSGCQYLLFVDRTVTPRIAADGKTHQGCRQGAKP